MQTKPAVRIKFKRYYFGKMDKGKFSNVLEKKH
jgi:hypothetical protein